MRPIFITTLLALLAMCFASTASADCTVYKLATDKVSTTDYCVSTGAGAAGPAGAQGEQGIAGEPGPAGADGKDGRDGLDYQSDEALALGAALSMPVWLQQNETGRISGGLGFSEGGETAVGATGVVRINKSWAAFGGGAVSTQGGAWAGKAGVSFGW